jgi:dephospho-CoA kinase
MGYKVYDTDKEAKRLIVENAQVRKQIEALFGYEVYKDDMYQTHIVAEKVFADKSLLAQLNAIVHPAVKTDILRWVTLQDSPSFRKGLGVGFYFVECAILYQAGFDALCDKVVAVTAPKDIRLARVIARDHSNIEKVRARMRAQEADKDLRRADLVVNNDGTHTISELCEQILRQLHLAQR